MKRIEALPAPDRAHPIVNGNDGLVHGEPWRSGVEPTRVRAPMPALVFNPHPYDVRRPAARKDEK